MGHACCHGHKHGHESTSYISSPLLWIFCIIPALLKLFVLLRYYLRTGNSKKKVIGFFHPYCNAGGGGERVLWCALRAVKKRYPDIHCVVYTGDKAHSADDIRSKAKLTFNIPVSPDVEFVFLSSRGWVEAKRYPILTLLGQSFGSVLMGIEALIKRPPDVFIDTMGYAFTLPIFSLIGGCYTGCYVHYPTISTDMLNVVKCRNDSFNNRKIIAQSKFLTQMKLMYYRLFAQLYGIAGRCSSSIMVNSSWTEGHILKLWKKPSSTHKVYPPCDISGFLDIPLKKQSEPKEVLSIAQFRPEKNHILQVKSFHAFLESIPSKERTNYKLIMAGGCRNPGDEGRVQELTDLVNELDISENVTMKTNISFAELKSLLSTATVGIHTMANEHFGIGVVEFQAAGVITLAHNSGGPKMDIVDNEDGDICGYLADDVTSYSANLKEIFDLTSEQVDSIQKIAREKCQRFSEEHFAKEFLKATKSLFV